jgi:cholesterol transport system auxiliary component
MKVMRVMEVTKGANCARGNGISSPKARSYGARLFAMACLATLTACSTGSLFDSDTPVPTNYVLAPAAAAPQTTNIMPVDLSVSRPDLAAGLDSDRIAVLRGRLLDYYRGVRWGTRAIELIQTLVVDSLEDQKLFRSVTAEQTRVAGDYVLDLQVRDFQAEYADGVDRPVVHVALVGRLIRVLDRKLVATVSSEARAEAQEERMSAVTGAFERASHEAILDLGKQVAAVVNGDADTLRTARGEDGGSPE